MTTPRIVVLVSGTGSNLQAIIDRISDGSINAEIAAVISNRPNVFGLERAAQAGIKTELVDHTQFDDRQAFDQKLQQVIDIYEPHLVVLAGFMRILTAEFTNHYLGRMLNIHPSLLPKYQGLYTHQRALDANDDCHGVTVHFVTAELDGGPNAIQAIVPVLDGDDVGTLSKRVQQQEHHIYPLAVQWFVEQRLSMDGQHCTLDRVQLPLSGYVLDSRDN